MTLEDVTRGKRATWARSDNVLIIAWHDGVCADDVNAFTAFTQQIAPRFPAGFAALSFSWIEHGVPDAATREALVEANKVRTDSYRGAAVILGGDGLVVSVMRTILASMSMVRKQTRAREVVVKGIDDAVERLGAMVTIKDERALRADAADLLKRVGR